MPVVVAEIGTGEGAAIVLALAVPLFSAAIGMILLAVAADWLRSLTKDTREDDE